MKKPDKKMIYRWLLAVDLTAMAVVTFIHSDPRMCSADTAALKSITFEGTWFTLGVILSPLIYRE